MSAVAKVRERVVKRFEFRKIRHIKPSTGEESYSEYIWVNGDTLIPITEAKRFTGRSRNYIDGLIRSKKLTGFKSNGQEKDERKRGSREPLYFSLEEWLNLK